MLNSADISKSLSSFSVNLFGLTNALWFTAGMPSDSSKMELPKLVLLPAILDVLGIGPAKTSTPPTSRVRGVSLRLANWDSIVSFNSAIFGLVREFWILVSFFRGSFSILQ